ncbi:UNVERIFIED_CONTAM: hypothetical protein NCL1_51005 [Trichonephila clavipes]
MHFAIARYLNMRSVDFYILNSIQANLVEGEERWKASDHPQGALSLNWGGTESNRTVTCMMINATTNVSSKTVKNIHNYVVLQIEDLSLLFLKFDELEKKFVSIKTDEVADESFLLVCP